MTQLYARIENGTVCEIIDFDPHGRFHPDLIWEPINATVEIGFVQVSGEWAAPPAPPPTNAAVTDEAERRIEDGVVVTVPGHTPTIYVQGRDKDTRNVQGLVTAAQLRLASGDTTTLTSFRDGNNVMHELTPAQVAALWQESAAYVTAVYHASWAIKAMDPIPADYADDSYWP
jgi:hypothetical protein